MSTRRRINQICVLLAVILLSGLLCGCASKSDAPVADNGKTSNAGQAAAAGRSLSASPEAWQSALSDTGYSMACDSDGLDTAREFLSQFTGDEADYTPLLYLLDGWYLDGSESGAAWVRADSAKHAKELCADIQAYLLKLQDYAGEKPSIGNGKGRGYSWRSYTYHSAYDMTYVTVVSDDELFLICLNDAANAEGSVKPLLQSVGIS